MEVGLLHNQAYVDLFLCRHAYTGLSSNAECIQQTFDFEQPSRLAAPLAHGAQGTGPLCTLSQLCPHLQFFA